MQQESFFAPTLIPLRTLLALICLTTPTSTSATIRNKKTDRGSPSLSPLEGLNSLIGLSFTNIEREVELKQLLI